MIVGQAALLTLAFRACTSMAPFSHFLFKSHYQEPKMLQKDIWYRGLIKMSYPTKRANTISSGIVNGRKKEVLQ